MHLNVNKKLLDEKMQKYMVEGWSNMKESFISKDKTVELTEIKGSIYLRLNKHKPIVIHADDKYRKGIEIDICHDCKCVSVITEYECNKDKKEIKRCSECSLQGINKLLKNHKE